MCFFINRTAVAGAPFGGKAHHILFHVKQMCTIVSRFVIHHIWCPLFVCNNVINPYNSMCLRRLFCATRTNMRAQIMPTMCAIADKKKPYAFFYLCAELCPAPPYSAACCPIVYVCVVGKGIGKGIRTAYNKAL